MKISQIAIKYLDKWGLQNYNKRALTNRYPIQSSKRTKVWKVKALNKTRASCLSMFTMLYYILPYIAYPAIWRVGTGYAVGGTAFNNRLVCDLKKNLDSNPFLGWRP